MVDGHAIRRLSDVTAAGRFLVASVGGLDTFTNSAIGCGSS